MSLKKVRHSSPKTFLVQIISCLVLYTKCSHPLPYLFLSSKYGKWARKRAQSPFCKWRNQGLKWWNLLTRVIQFKSGGRGVHTGCCTWIQYFFILQCLHTLEKPSKLEAVIYRCSENRWLKKDSTSCKPILSSIFFLPEKQSTKGEEIKGEQLSHSHMLRNQSQRLFLDGTLVSI